MNGDINVTPICLQANQCGLLRRSPSLEIEGGSQVPQLTSEHTLFDLACDVSALRAAGLWEYPVAIQCVRHYVLITQIRISIATIDTRTDRFESLGSDKVEVLLCVHGVTRAR